MNFISKNVTFADKELFFGPFDEDEEFCFIDENWIMAHLLTTSGNFPSISQAKKNGWNKPIPKGFSILTVGKKAKKKEIFILNI